MMLIFAIILSISSSCSAAMEAKIVGGLDAKIEDWPFIAFIVYHENNGQFLPACGGSLLSSRTILTAAHCLDDITNHKKELDNYQGIYVLMGNANIYNSSLVRTGIDYVTHSKYDWEDTPYDIGILLLDEPVTFSNTVKKVVLWTKPLNERSKEILFVAGWGGATGLEGEMSKKLQYLVHKLIPRKVCQSRLPLLDLEEGTICAGTSKASQFVFSGDSGGPLITADGFQVGIVSYKLEKESGGVTIFTSIANYAGWIEKAQAKLLRKYTCRN